VHPFIAVVCPNNTIRSLARRSQLDCAQTASDLAQIRDPDLTAIPAVGAAGEQQATAGVTDGQQAECTAGCLVSAATTNNKLRYTT